VVRKTGLSTFGCVGTSDEDANGSAESGSNYGTKEAPKVTSEQ